MGLLSRKMRRTLHVLTFRCTGGSKGGTRVGDGYDIPCLLLTTIGRKSGKKRTVPLGYMEDGPNYVITGSDAGAGKDPAWILNLNSDPRATLQVKGASIPVLAERPDPDERSRLWARLVDQNRVFGTYQARTSREIPVVILRPRG